MADTVVWVVVTAIVVAGGYALVFRFWGQRTARHNFFVNDINDDLKEMGDRFNLRFCPSSPYAHPVIGALAQFGTLEGDFGPFQINFSIRSEMTNNDEELPILWFPVIHVLSPVAENWCAESLNIDDSTIDSLYTPDAIQRAVAHFSNEQRQKRAYHALMGLLAESTRLSIENIVLTVERKSAQELPGNGFMYESRIAPIEELQEWLACVKAVTDIWSEHLAESMSADGVRQP
ncbi:MAG: hypothetical protein JXX14_03245 [Deltaproteobacteria bacterium]|nr:hypothetical protein [Deltaproteobacteria bacterium]